MAEARLPQLREDRMTDPRHFPASWSNPTMQSPSFAISPPSQLILPRRYLSRGEPVLWRAEQVRAHQETDQMIPVMVYKSLLRAQLIGVPMSIGVEESDLCRVNALRPFDYAS
jgi:hypothetical protein